MSDKCEWSRDPDDEQYETVCGHAFMFNDDGPLENGFKHCPYCGCEIVAEPYGEEKGDDA